MPSSTVEDYLKELYVAETESEEAMTSTGRLATAMGVVPGTATSMMKALADSGLVEYEPRQGARLTERGRRLALHVLRRHRLVELFLVNILGLDWSVVHDEADALEHAVSDQVLKRIDLVLGHPTVDPHGDPIPTLQGDVQEAEHPSLIDCALDRPLEVARVMDQSPEFLRFAEQHGLVPGARIAVVERESAAGAARVRAADGGVVALGFPAAAKILVSEG